MNDEKLVLVKYYNPEYNATEFSLGWLQEAAAKRFDEALQVNGRKAVEEVIYQ